MRKNGKIGLIYLWLANPSISIAKPVAIPTAKVGEAELTTILASDKLLGPLLLANLAQLVWFLIKSIYDSKRKQLEDIQKAVSVLPTLIEKIEIIDERLRHTVTHEQAELKILRAFREHKT